MSERRKIVERLRKKEQEVQLLEEKIRDAKTYIQALQDVLKILPKETSDAVSPTNLLRAGSMVAKARDIILKAGGPVHVSTILEQLGKETSRENRASIASSIAAYVRRSEIFTRPAPNTFGLIELGHKSVESPVSEPPDDFGSVGPSSSDEIEEEIPF